MEKLGKHNDRMIYYLNIKESISWETELPHDYWLVLPIGHKKDIELIKKVSRICLDKNVNYMCALGLECELIHDTFEEVLVDRRIEKGLSVDSPDDFKKEPMTTWHEDFGEGVWFSLTTAFNDYKKIKKVVCLDLTDKGEKEKLLDFIDKINKGWLPDD